MQVKRSDRGRPAGDDGDALFSALLSALDEGVIIHRRDGAILRANDAACRVLGRALSGVLQGPGDVPAWMVTEDPQPVSFSFYTGEPQVKVALRVHRPDGETRWLSVTTMPLPPVNGRVPWVVETFTDITEHRAEVERSTWQATHDAVTRLPNQSQLLDRMAHALARRDRGMVDVAFLLCEVDRLDEFRSDGVLAEIACRVSAVARTSDTVALLPGDQFAVLAEGVQRSGAITLARRLQHAMAQPLDADGTVQVTLSIGLTTRGATVDAMLAEADAAMFRSKIDGGDRIAVFEPDGRPARTVTS